MALTNKFLKALNLEQDTIDLILGEHQNTLEEIKTEKNKYKADSEKLKESIAEEWSDFITSSRTKGADVKNPPNNSGGKLLKEEILKIKDPKKRQKAIAENMDAFGY